MSQDYDELWNLFKEMIFASEPEADDSTLSQKVRSILEVSPNVGLEQNDKGASLLMLATAYCSYVSVSVRLMEWVLPYSDANQQSGAERNMWTALHYAAKAGEMAAVKILLPLTRSGVNPLKESLSEDGKVAWRVKNLEQEVLTPDQIATQFGHHEVANYILNYRVAELEKQILMHETEDVLTPSLASVTPGDSDLKMNALGVLGRKIYRSL